MSQSSYPPANLDQDIALQSEDSISIGNILHVFWLRRRMFIAVFSLVLILGIVILFQLVPQYTADTKILVGIAKAKVVDVEAVLKGDINTDSAVKSEVEVLSSRELIKKVVKKLNLTSIEEFNPELKQLNKKESIVDFKISDWLPEEFKQAMDKPGPELTEEERKEKQITIATNIYISNLTVAPVKGSQVIQVTFKSTDPKLAAQIANAHAESYIIGQLEAKFDATQKATNWLNEQLADLRAKVASSEQAVESYRAQHNLTRVSGGDGLLQKQLTEVNSQLIIAKASRAEAAARLKQVESLLQNGANIETASEVLSSSLIQQLRGQEAELTRKASEMAVEYGAKHPKMIRINAEIADLQNNIKSEIRKIAAGLRNELNVASSREQSLQSSLSAVEVRTGSSQKEEVQLHALEREANANKLLFETFLNRFKETSTTKGMDQADARAISMAVTPEVPSFPKKKLMLSVIILLAVFIGTAVIFIMEMLNPGLRTPEEVEAVLGMPTIGLIPLTKEGAINYILEKPHSSLAEAISSLRVSIMLSDPDKAVKTVLICSSVPAEGKSTLALCLARSAAQAGQKVILIDADLRRPTIEKKLGLPPNVKGLTDFVRSHEENISNFVIKDEKTSLIIMPKGEAEYVNPVDVFNSHRMANIIDILKAEFDLVIFDSPPVMAVTDSRILTSLVDKTIFTVNWDKTPKKVVKAGLQQLLTAKANIAGIVLQQVNLKQYGKYGYGDSGYYYHYGKYGQYYSN